MKLYQKYLVLLLIVLVLLSLYFNLQKKEEYVNNVHTVLINLLNKQIEREKAEAFNFAFALSQNETLQSAIKTNDSIKGYEILKQHMNALEIFSGSKMRAQILTKEYVIFARSWDNSDAGLNVKKFRPDLQEIKISKNPHLSFEAARRLVLIASIPIVRNGEVVGFIEVIHRFNSLEEYFLNYDISMIALLNSKYKNQAVLLNNNPVIENMIIANNGANVEHIAYLKKTGISKLLNQGQLEGKNHFYFSRAILNSNGDNIGYFILIISKQKLELFSAFERELNAFFTYARKDLYYSVLKNSESIDSNICLNKEKAVNNPKNISRGKIK
ncbi:hypothetical protein GJV85_03210 [Sulfurimonas aquatica]|uniref:Double Cache domain-containing protein n=1 Tax=Sulfurimonas aquatica TaxID=2672570 RepID=A0A975AZ56_9BACT|nr:cache domain-containing protein [Sulfurimonas aquatica]QSZ41160.1 hypothetical protein GJV85_03210 [Sulfurimonas aquatica]